MAREREGKSYFRAVVRVSKGVAEYDGKVMLIAKRDGAIERGLWVHGHGRRAKHHIDILPRAF